MKNSEKDGRAPIEVEVSGEKKERSDRIKKKMGRVAIELMLKGYREADEDAFNDGLELLRARHGLEGSQTDFSDETQTDSSVETNNEETQTPIEDSAEAPEKRKAEESFVEEPAEDAQAETANQDEETAKAEDGETQKEFKPITLADAKAGKSLISAVDVADMLHKKYPDENQYKLAMDWVRVWDMNTSEEDRLRILSGERPDFLSDMTDALVDAGLIEISKDENLEDNSDNAEENESQKEFKPITLADAKAGRALISAADVADMLHKKYPDKDQYDLIIGKIQLWNMNISEEDRILYLSGGSTEYSKDLVDTLVGAGLIEISKEEVSEEESDEKPENQSEDDKEEDVDNDAEKQENVGDFDPMTLEKAESSKRSDINIEEVRAKIKEKYGEGDEAANLIGNLRLYDLLSHEERISILKGEAEGDNKALGGILAKAGLIKIGHGEKEDDKKEEETKSPEELEAERSDLLEKLFINEAFMKWIAEQPKTDEEGAEKWTPVDVRNMSLDELKEWERRFNESNNSAEGESNKGDEDREAADKLREELKKKFAFMEWLKNRKKGDGSGFMTEADLDAMSLKELEELWTASIQETDDGSMMAVDAKLGEAERRARQVAEEEIENRIKELQKHPVKNFFKLRWSMRFGKEKQIEERTKKLTDLIKEKNQLVSKKKAFEAGVEGVTFTDENEARLQEILKEVSDDVWSTSGNTERFVLAQINNASEDVLSANRNESATVYGVEHEKDADGNDITKVYKREKNADGEIIKTEVDAESDEAKRAIEIESAIREYASKIEEIWKRQDLDKTGKDELEANALDEFRRTMAQSRWDVIRNKEDSAKSVERAAMIEGYENVAIEAGMRAKHGMGMENAMKGFAYIDAEMNREVSTKEIKSAYEKLSNFFMKFPVTEAAAAVGAGVAIGLTQSTTGTVGRIAMGIVGGGIGAGVFSAIENGLKMRRQYITAQRSVATSGELVGGRREAKMYENALRYMKDEHGNIIKASEVSTHLGEDQKIFEDALAKFQSDPSDENRETLKTASSILGLRAEGARSRLKLGDLRGLDMMQFSSQNLEVIEDERLAIWKGIASAEAALDRARKVEGVGENDIVDVKKVLEEREKANEAIIKGANRAKRNNIILSSVGRGALTGGLAIGIGEAVREIHAIIDNNEMSVLEGFDIIKGQRRGPDVKNTPLAALLERSHVRGFRTSDIIGSQDGFATHEEAEAFIREHGGNPEKINITEYADPSRDVPGNPTTVNDGQFARENFERIGGRHWVLGANEQRLYGGDAGSMHVDMQGSVGELQRAGDLRLNVSFSGDSQMNPLSLPIKPDGSVDYSGVSSAVMEKLQSNDVWCAEVVHPNGDSTDVFATMLYKGGGHDIVTPTTIPGFSYRVDAMTFTNEGVSANRLGNIISNVAGAAIASGARGIGIKRNTNGGASGSNTPPKNNGGPTVVVGNQERERGTSGDRNVEGIEQDEASSETVTPIIERAPVDTSVETESTTSNTENAEEVVINYDENTDEGREDGRRQYIEALFGDEDNKEFIADKGYDKKAFIDDPERYSKDEIERILVEEKTRWLTDRKIEELFMTPEFMPWFESMPKTEGEHPENWDREDLKAMNLDELKGWQERFNNRAAEAAGEAQNKAFENVALLRKAMIEDEDFGAWGDTLDDDDPELLNADVTALRERYERELAALRAEFSSDADSDLATWFTTTRGQNLGRISSLGFGQLSEYKRNFEDAVKSLRSELAGTPDVNVDSMGYKELMDLKKGNEAGEALASVRPVTIDDIRNGVFVNENRTETLADRMGTNLSAIEKTIGHGITKDEFDKLKTAAGQFVAMAPRAHQYDRNGLKEGQDGGFLNSMQKHDGYMRLLFDRGLIA